MVGPSKHDPPSRTRRLLLSPLLPALALFLLSLAAALRSALR